MSGVERRAVQRLKLPKPMQAMVEGQHALILDIGMAGVFVEHPGKWGPGQRFTLTFSWRGAPVHFTCEVARSRVTRPAAGGAPVISQTGARFAEAHGDAAATLNDMIATFIGRILSAQKGNANATAPDDRNAVMLAQMGEARRQRATGWITCRLTDGRWRCANSASPQQPADGFTVGGFEDEDEIEVLCQTYSDANDEGRRLIRMVAELSAAAVSGPRTT